MKFTITIIIIGLLLLYIMYTMVYKYREITYVKSNIDGRTYMIRRGNKSKIFLQESADTLANINYRVEKLISHLLIKYKDDESKIYFIKKMDENYSPKMISEAYVDPKFTTYTIDKTDLHICLRTRDSNETIYDINTLMYVVFHETAHMGNYSKEGREIIGHGREFKMIFRFLVEEAILLGLYKYVDYTSIPQEYCGIKIESQILN